MHIESNPDPHHRAGSHSEDGAGRFHHYIEVIEQLARGRLVLKPVERRQRIAACLDGEPGQVLRRASDGSRLRQQGAYFTGAKLATKLANAVEPNSQQVYFDPTCGAGDLLLAVAKKLPVSDTLGETIANWGRCLAGCDICPDFVRLTKARLVLLAAKRCRVCPTRGRVVPSRTFPKIGDADFLSQSTRVGRADVVIMNPPFGYTLAYDACEWAQRPNQCRSDSSLSEPFGSLAQVRGLPPFYRMYSDRGVVTNAGGKRSTLLVRFGTNVPWAYSIAGLMLMCTSLTS